MTISIVVYVTRAVSQPMVLVSAGDGLDGRHYSNLFPGLVQ